MIREYSNIEIIFKQLTIVFFVILFSISTANANDTEDIDKSSELIAEGTPENTPPTDIPKTNKTNFILNTSDPEMIFVNITYARLFSNTVTAYYFNDMIFYPVAKILDELRINYEVSNGGDLVKGKFITNDLSYKIDFASLSASIGEKNISFSNTDLLKVDGKYYLLPEILENLFDMNMKMNFGNLTVTITSKAKLPVLIFNEFASGRNKLSKDITEESAPLLYQKERSIFNLGFIDYSINGNYSRNSDPIYNYDIMTGTEILGGNLNTTLKGSINQKNDKTFFENMSKSFIWNYTLNNNPYLNQINVGEMINSGLTHSKITGIRVTNTPVELRTTFDKFTITEKTIPNSDVELYLNNRLYDFKKADALGNVFFEVPITYGSNDIYLKIFSPTGEIITNEKKVLVPSGFLPAGSIDYNAAYGVTGLSDDKYYSADVAAGITNWLTNKIGFEKIENDLFSKPVWYNSLSARILSEYYLNVTTAPDAFYSASLNANLKSRASFEMMFTKFQENPIYNKTNLNNEIMIRGLVPFDLFGNTFITRALVRNHNYLNNSNTLKFDIEQGLNLSGFNASVNFSHTKNDFNTDSESVNKVSLGTYFYTSKIPLLDFLKNNVINTKVDYNFSKKELEAFHTTLTSNITNSIKLQLGFRTGFTKGSTSLTAQFAFDMPFARNYVSMSNNSVSTLIQGSLGLDMSDKKIEYSFHNRPQVGSSAVIFRMFHDENNNGKYDSGEEIIDDINLNLRNVGTIGKNSQNIHQAIELNPNIEYVVEINDISPKYPTLFPMNKRFSFVPSANVYKKVDIPFYRTQEVFGSVVIKRNEDEFRLGGIKVTIQNTETNEVTEIATYSDGGLYHIGLMPGKYVAFVNQAHLDNLKGVSNPGTLNFTINGSQSSMNELNFVINLD